MPQQKARAAPSTSTLPSSVIGQWLSIGTIGVAFLALTVWSWRKWPDSLVDFGQQLYIPWRLASGERLYRDIALLHGPLSQHVNAILFKIFGASFTVLIFANLVVLAVITALVYRLFQATADRLTATTACLLLLALFGFSQYVGTGNYNYIAPYTHESTHGMLLLVGMVLAMARYLSHRTRVAAATAGLCLGLALLTKVDIAFAAAGVLGVAAVTVALTISEREPLVPADLALFGGAAVLPFVLFFLFFLTYLPAAAALRGARSGFALVSNEVTTNPFYLRVLGFDNVGANTVKMLTSFVEIAIGVGLAAGVDVAASRLFRRPGPVGVALGIALAVVLLLNLDAWPWTDLPRALPLTTGLALAAFGWLFIRNRFDRARRSPAAAMVLWSTLALALLSKVVLYARIPHYGFYLAMPATVLLAACLVGWLPQVLRRRLGGSGIVFRSLALAVLGVLVVFYLGTAENGFYRLKTLPLGRGGDSYLTFGSPAAPTIGSIMGQTLDWIDANVPADATFAALPEGITLNYLARRPTTLPVINFMMTEEVVFGEDVMVAAFERRPPDYVLLVHKDTSEFGFGAFGQDERYGGRIMDWVDRHYDPVTVIGAEPFRTRAFGIKILKHK